MSSDRSRDGVHVALFGLVVGTLLTLTAQTTAVIAIHREMRAQRAAQAFVQLRALTEEWDSDRMRRIRLRLALALKAGGEDPETDALVALVWGFFDRLGLLRRQHYLGADVVFDAIGGEVVRWWTVMQGPIEQARAAYGDQEVADLEALAGEHRALMAKRGVPEFKTDPESIAGRLDWIIEHQTQALRLEQELRTGVIPSAGVGATASAAATEAAD